MNPVFHFLFMEHTAAAMHNKRIIFQIFGKFTAGGKGISRLYTRKFRNPMREFDGSNVTALAVMGAALGNQNLVTIMERRQLGQTSPNKRDEFLPYSAQTEWKRR